MEGENMNECLNRIGNLEKSIGKLETVIEERFQHFEENLKRMETSLTAKLDKIDEDIRGNGKVGINIRLGRLENSQKLASRYFRIIVAAVVPALISTYLSWAGISFH